MVLRLKSTTPTGPSSKLIPGPGRTRIRLIDARFPISVKLYPLIEPIAAGAAVKRLWFEPS